MTDSYDELASLHMQVGLLTDMLVEVDFAAAERVLKRLEVPIAPERFAGAGSRWDAARERIAAELRRQIENGRDFHEWKTEDARRAAKQKRAEQAERRARRAAADTTGRELRERVSAVSGPANRTMRKVG